MATFRQYTNKSGITAVTATVRIKQGGDTVFVKSKTFSKQSNAQNQQQAERWARKLEADIELHGIPTDQLRHNTTAAELIASYLADPHTVRMGRSKRSDMLRIASYAIAAQPVQQLTSTDYTQHINQRLNNCKPQTAANDLVWLAVILDYARAEHGIPVNRAELDAARKYLRSVGKIAKPNRRHRIPTADEHRSLLAFFADPQYESPSVPMYDLLQFAQYSARRIAEITRLEWSDNDAKHQTGIVRDAKHPRKKEGNHLTFLYTEQAWEIAQRQPRTSEFIFPYNPKTVGAYFQRACKILQIEDLHWHDYRHLATTWLFVGGKAIHEVAGYTLHESWDTLKIYTHLTPQERGRVEAVYKL